MALEIIISGRRIYNASPFAFLFLVGVCSRVIDFAGDESHLQFGARLVGTDFYV